MSLSSDSLEISRQKVETGIESLSDTEVYLPDGVDVHFQFSAHVTAEDLGDLEAFHQRVDEADIIILELAGWNKLANRGYNQVSCGNPEEYKRQIDYFTRDDDTYNIAVSSALYDTHKPVIFADIAEEDPLFPDVHRLMQLRTGHDLVRKPQTDDLEESARIAVRAQEQFATGQAYRERRLLSNIGMQLDAEIGNNKNLAEKNRVKALFIVGALHTSLFHSLRTVSGEHQITRSFGSSNPVYPAGQEIQRARLLGIELTEEKKREAVIQGFFHEIVHELVKQSGQTKDRLPYEVDRIASEIRGKFAQEAVERYFNLDKVKQKKAAGAFIGKVRRQTRETAEVT